MANASFERIAVVGLGYIGLPTAAVFAGRKRQVIGIDVNRHAVDTINRGEIHITEPDLDIVVRAVVSEGYLRATTTPEPADAFLIAVPTPFRGGRHGGGTEAHEPDPSPGGSGAHEPDLSYVEAASRAIAPVLRRGDLVVLESTSPVGTTERMAAWLAEMRPDLTFPQTHGEASDIRVAHCPERVLPGHVLRELVQNDRVIGGMTPACAARAVALYRIFVEGECILTDTRTAEMVKLTENSFRDANIAFANEVSVICDRLGIDVWELIRLANRHPRVNILQPGPGVGGHCIAVDPWFIVSAAPEEARLIRTAREVNDAKPAWVLARIEAQVAEAAARAGRRPDEIAVACFGLAFKADIDDLRESPALAIAEALARRHPGPLLAVEPHVAALPATLAGRARLCTAEEALAEADVLALLVDHSAFRALPPEALAARARVDTRGIWTGARTGLAG
ncbi:UDP-N-acetyl-D-mannosamine dehydrogenase [Amaricoccus sp.]|uniref:UDP-N-acetyl-D-mannosamine dehydrogenase n=1 Tax=Amaricoccus sp. TaxID=1872485 RepID=UPI001B57BAF2|nr:UDP-N-acetyl-D-mannosamine dehydrogenase [Amaricoccus sp.]MBP7003016.1 UDP-N-acetyl-D-mannosamine dehydrogenase [Amaricoccus sp.]